MGTRERSTSKRLQSILCAVDFSLPSYAALQKAIEIARGCNARVTALCVDDPLLGAGAAASGYDTGLLRKSTVAQLERLMRRMAQPAGLPADAWGVESVTGKPARTIVAFARKISADLIVMGTNGRMGPAKLFFGSVADEVLRSAPAPVLVVARSRPKRGTSAATGPVIGAIELEGHEREDARRMGQYAALLGGRLTLVHVVSRGNAAGPAGAALDALQQPEVDDARKRLEKVAAAVGADSRIMLGKADEEIAAAASQAKASLIVLALRRGRGIFGRRQGATTYRVLSASSTPVLALPPA